VAPRDPLRHLSEHERLRGAFGSDAFGRAAERASRFFGTPRYIVGQSVGVVLWIVANAIGWSLHWDPYPFILLNLAFSTQAAYAAPLILLAQTRQAARDQAHAEAGAKHMEELALAHQKLLDENTRLTLEIRRIAEEIHAHVVAPPADR
jgi:uncharacterized membrane protein